MAESKKVEKKEDESFPGKLTKMGKKLLQKLIQKDTIPQPKKKFGDKSWQEYVAEKFDEEEVEGVRRGRRNLKKK